MFLDKDTLFAQNSLDWRAPFALNQPPGIPSNPCRPIRLGHFIRSWTGYFTGWRAPHSMANNDACGHVTMPHTRMGPLFARRTLVLAEPPAEAG